MQGATTADASMTDVPQGQIPASDFPVVQTHSGRFIQYNIFGNLFEITTKYRPPIMPIGRGAYGIVCSVLNSETNEMVAIKKIANAFDNHMDAKRTLREIKLLRHLDHENDQLRWLFSPSRGLFNVLGFLSRLKKAAPLATQLSSTPNNSNEGGTPLCIEDGGSALLITRKKRIWVIGIRDVVPPPVRSAFADVYYATELMDTDLHQIIRSNQDLSEEHSQYFLYQLLRGLKYIHSANVIHRDLKPSNLLLNANCDLKICDFGLARPTSENEFMTEYVVTRWYRAPELLLNSADYTASIDVWSVGCIFMELMNRRPLFAGRDHVHQMRLLTELLGTPTEAELGFVRNEDAKRYIKQLPSHPRQAFTSIFPHINPEALDLVERMLSFDPNQRITVEEALDHPYLARLHDIADEPVCPEPFSFEFEQQVLTEEQIKEMIYREALEYNPEYAHW
ncbi:hypothetical protein IFM89_022095 [Coptis chinensis]|uniref:Protein kinase domain-containing protein n=1 Tax=Coptis chinensis TaxID=261450 RepID=A0A835HJ86_9MAGN|nr:hypothetical protein IFM89_022095 [Coptis chinensis]